MFKTYARFALAFAAVAMFTAPALAGMQTGEAEVKIDIKPKKSKSTLGLPEGGKLKVDIKVKSHKKTKPKGVFKKFEYRLGDKNEDKLKFKNSEIQRVYFLEDMDGHLVLVEGLGTIEVLGKGKKKETHPIRYYVQAYTDGNFKVWIRDLSAKSQIVQSFEGKVSAKKVKIKLDNE